MTTRTLVFDSPFVLGFEHTRMLIERVARADAEAYPRYNVEQLDDDSFRISLAVAGFTKDHLQVTVQDKQLVVVGRRDEASASLASTYLHRGIAARAFQRTFVLADGMEVGAAVLEDGLLQIDISGPKPDSSAKIIAISAG